MEAVEYNINHEPMIKRLMKHSYSMGICATNIVARLA